jgi:hypothetical protein
VGTAAVGTGHGTGGTGGTGAGQIRGSPCPVGHGKRVAQKNEEHLFFVVVTETVLKKMKSTVFLR